MNKKNRDYWRGRFEQLQASLLKPADDYLSELENAYNKAQRDIEKDIAVWYQRFADNNGIVDMAEARRILNARELKELKWDINEYIKYGQENAVNQKWVKELENASARVHISRLEGLKIQARQLLEKLYSSIESDLTNMVKKTYEDSYYKTAYEVVKGLDINTTLSGINDEMINKIIKKPWAVDKKNFSERIWVYKETAINTIYQEINRGLIGGKTVDEMSKRLAKATHVKESNARRLILTESAYFSSLGSQDSFNQLGLKKFEVLGTLDSTTCSWCGSLDSKIYDMKDYEIAVTAPPFHCHCRCTTVPYFDDEFTEGEKRTARGADGKTILVNDMSYKEWKERFVKEDVAKGKENGIINVNPTKVIDGHSPPPIKSIPNDIIDHIGKNGKVKTRAFYDEYGNKIIDIHTDNHGNSKNHPYGNNGEHAHTYKWSDGKIIERTTRGLTSVERKENGDIL